MFWNRRPICPVTLEDKKWIIQKLDWINENIINLENQPTYQPSREHFDIDYKGEKEDAVKTLEILCEYLNIDIKKINLDFYSEENVEIARGLSTKNIGAGSAGKYLGFGKKKTILIEISGLKNTESLISTMVHELCHYIIMEKKKLRLERDENELLTDLLVIAYGFGIFQGNTKFTFNQWSSGDGWGGWSSSSKGYLPQVVIAYAMADIQRRKNDYHPKWGHYLKDSFSKDFKRSLKYIRNEYEK